MSGNDFWLSQSFASWRETGSDRECDCDQSEWHSAILYNRKMSLRDIYHRYVQARYIRAECRMRISWVSTACGACNAVSDPESDTWQRYMVRKSIKRVSMLQGYIDDSRQVGVPPVSGKSEGNGNSRQKTVVLHVSLRFVYLETPKFLEWLRAALVLNPPSLHGMCFCWRILQNKRKCLAAFHQHPIQGIWRTQNVQSRSGKSFRSSPVHVATHYGIIKLKSACYQEAEYKKSKQCYKCG